MARHSSLLTSGSRILGNAFTIASGAGLGGSSHWRMVAGILGVAAGTFLLAFGKKPGAELEETPTFAGKLQEKSVKIYTAVMMLCGAALTTSGVEKGFVFEAGAGIATVLGSGLQTVPKRWVERIFSSPMKVGAFMKQPPLVCTVMDAIARGDYSRLFAVTCFLFSNHAEGKLKSEGGTAR